MFLDIIISSHLNLFYYVKSLNEAFDINGKWNMEFVLNAISWTHDSSQEKFILVIKFSCSKCLEVLEETNLSTLILLRNVESLADCTDKHSVGSDIDLNQTRVFEFY